MMGFGKSLVRFRDEGRVCVYGLEQGKVVCCSVLYCSVLYCFVLPVPCSDAIEGDDIAVRGVLVGRKCEVR